MKKIIYGLEIETTESGDIFIRQNECGDEGSVVISKDQAPILIKWLQEAVNHHHDTDDTDQEND